MAAEQGSVSQMVFNTGLNLYRKTFKRLRPVHMAAHWLMTHLAIPVLESRQHFHTMPDDPFWFRLELLTNRHEYQTTQHVKAIVKPGMTVLDIGAHVGYYARLFASLVGENGRVIAFEPHPRNRDFLTRNTHNQPHVRISPVAAAEQEGTAELYDYLMMSASGSLHYDETLRDVQQAQIGAGDVAPRLQGQFDGQKYTVRTAPVDDCLAEMGINQVDVIKMDIEGAEIGALRGMTRTIAQSPRLSLIMEYNPLGLKAFGHEPLTIIPDVLAMGFHQVFIIEDETAPDKTPKDETAPVKQDITADEHAIQQLTQRLTTHMGVVNLLFVRDVTLETNN